MLLKLDLSVLQYILLKHHTLSFKLNNFIKNLKNKIKLSKYKIIKYRKTILARWTNGALKKVKQKQIILEVK